MGWKRVLTRISHEQFVSFYEKETKTDGVLSVGRLNFRPNVPQTLSPGGTTFDSLLAAHIPKEHEVPKFPYLASPEPMRHPGSKHLLVV